MQRAGGGASRQRELLMAQKLRTTRRTVDNCENPINYLEQIVIVNNKCSTYLTEKERFHYRCAVGVARQSFYTAISRTGARWLAGAGGTRDKLLITFDAYLHTREDTR